MSFREFVAVTPDDIWTHPTLLTELAKQRRFSGRAEFGTPSQYASEAITRLTHLHRLEIRDRKVVEYSTFYYYDVHQNEINPLILKSINEQLKSGKIPAKIEISFHTPTLEYFLNRYYNLYANQHRYKL